MGLNSFVRVYFTYMVFILLNILLSSLVSFPISDLVVSHFKQFLFVLSQFH